MIEGIIVVDKPPQWTSFDVVKKLRGLTGTKRVGHAGTLDPMASGVLAVLFGRATKLASKFLNGDKGYEGEITFGIRTSSLDADGEIIDSSPVNDKLTANDVEEIFKGFVGEIKQIPPMVSAKHHKGKRLYELARKGQVVEREPAVVTIHELSLWNFLPGEFPKARFYCRCSKGTYIRSLASDIGDALGLGAHLSALRRVYSHPFKEAQAKSMNDIEGLIKTGGIDKIVIDPEEIGLQ